MIVYASELNHFGVLGMRWGVRRYQNTNGTLTPAGKEHRAKWIARERNKLNKQYDYYDRKYAKKAAKAGKRGDKTTKDQYERMRKENASDRVKASRDLDDVSFEQIRQSERENLARTAKAASIAASVGIGIAASPVGGIIAGYAGKSIGDLMSSINVSRGKQASEQILTNKTNPEQFITETTNPRRQISDSVIRQRNKPSLPQQEDILLDDGTIRTRFKTSEDTRRRGTVNTYSLVEPDVFKDTDGQTRYSSKIGPSRQYPFASLERDKDGVEQYRFNYGYGSTARSHTTTPVPEVFYDLDNKIQYRDEIGPRKRRK